MACEHEAILNLQKLAKHIDSDNCIGTVAGGAHNVTGLYVYAQFRALLKDVAGIVAGAHETKVLATVVSDR